MSCSAWMVATIECIERSRARESCAISAPSPTIGRSVSASGVEQLVLDADDRAVPASAARGGVRRRAARPRSPGRRRAAAGARQSISSESRLVVAQADPADVARLRGSIDRVEVEAAEDQALVGGVELGDPLGGLEDHRVALDEAALVPQPAAAVALAGQLLGGRWRTRELARRPGPRTPARPRSRCSTSSSDNAFLLPKLPPKRSACGLASRQAYLLFGRADPRAARGLPDGYSSELTQWDRPHFLRERNAVIASRASSEANSRALSVGHLLAVGVDPGDQVAVEDPLGLAQALGGTGGQRRRRPRRPRRRARRPAPPASPGRTPPPRRR